MLDHPVNQTAAAIDYQKRGGDYLHRRTANRKRRNSIAGQSEAIKAAREKLSTEITVDAIDELAFAWARAIYARGGA